MDQEEINEIKRYLIYHMNVLWRKNKDFVAVYGGDYAEKQLEKNFRDLILNQKSILDISGEYSLITRNIHSYNAENPIYNLDELLHSSVGEQILEVLEHELLHAIFSKNLDTEDDYNKRKTGIEFYDEEQEAIINTPLNEGYTEYLRRVLDKGGSNSYIPYAKVFYVLERKLGRRNVIALSQGNVVDNMAHAFNMSEEDFIEFARYGERMFQKEKKIRILETEFKKLCKQFPNETAGNAEYNMSVLNFDRKIYRSLYKISIMDILQVPIEKMPDLEELKEFIWKKIDKTYEQTEEYHEILYDRAQNKGKSLATQTVFSKIRRKIIEFFSKPHGLGIKDDLGIMHDYSNIGAGLEKKVAITNDTRNSTVNNEKGISYNKKRNFSETLKLNNDSNEQSNATGNDKSTDNLIIRHNDDLDM